MIIQHLYTVSLRWRSSFAAPQQQPPNPRWGRAFPLLRVEGQSGPNAFPTLWLKAKP